MLRKHADKIILALGLCLRLIGLGHGSLWHDEAFTGLVAPLPWPRFWEALLGDVHPPLWYLIERVVVAVLGNTAPALRLPAALCSAAALILFWRLLFRLSKGASRCAPTWTSIAALAILAVSPFQVYYAQEARMYGALTLAAVLILIGVLEDRPWTFALGAVLALWLHNLGFIYVLTGVIALLIQRIRTCGDVAITLFRWSLPGMAALLASLPALIWTWRQVDQVSESYWIIDHSVGSWLYNTAFCTLFGQGVIDSRLSWTGALISLVIFLGGLLIALRSRRWDLAILAAGPGLIMLLISNTIRPLLLARTLIGATPALYLMAGQLFTTPRRRVILALALLPVMLSGLTNHYVLERRGNVDELVDIIEDLQPSAVVHSQSGSWIVVAWHMRNDPDITHLLWTGAAHGLGNSISDRTGEALGMYRVPLSEIPRPVAVIYADYALVSPEERDTVLAELEEIGAECIFTLADDDVQRVDLWMVR